MAVAASDGHLSICSNSVHLQVCILISHQLENVAIANALQLEAARALSRFNYDATPSLKLPNLSIAVYYNTFVTDALLYAVTFIFDVEHLQHIPCDVMKLCTKFERNRAIRGGVIAISMFDLMTSNIALRAAPFGIVFTKFDLRQLIRA